VPRPPSPPLRMSSTKPSPRSPRPLSFTPPRNAKTPPTKTIDIKGRSPAVVLSSPSRSSPARQPSPLLVSPQGTLACPSGYNLSSTGSCFRAISKLSSAVDAAAECAKHATGGTLAVIRSRVEDDMVHKLCASVIFNIQCYIGLARVLPSNLCSSSFNTPCNGDTACKCSYIWPGDNLTAKSYVGWAPKAPQWTSSSCVRTSATGTNVVVSID
jgi:hypothetical protein